MAATKTVCPMSRDEFSKLAKPIMARDALAAQFAKPLFRDRKPDASDLWNVSGPTTITVGDTPLQVQMSVNITVIGSKASAKDTAKKRCVVTAEEFKAHAKPCLASDLVGSLLCTVRAGVDEFESGSFGWYANGQGNVQIAGKVQPVQIGISLTVIGSKELPKLAAGTSKAG